MIDANYARAQERERERESERGERGREGGRENGRGKGKERVYLRARVKTRRVFPAQLSSYKTKWRLSRRSVDMR